QGIVGDFKRATPTEFLFLLGQKGSWRNPTQAKASPQEVVGNLDIAQGQLTGKGNGTSRKKKGK
ncbi:hypothetical protein, partial [Thermus sp.]|uniref:hypothetical protein n=1 Tax=Thermus sp. TaxID=275 RepID=UPI00262B634A